MLVLALVARIIVLAVDAKVLYDVVQKLRISTGVAALQGVPPIAPSRLEDAPHHPAKALVVAFRPGCLRFASFVHPSCGFVAAVAIIYPHTRDSRLLMYMDLTPSVVEIIRLSSLRSKIEHSLALPLDGHSPIIS